MIYLTGTYYSLFSVSPVAQVQSPESMNIFLWANPWSWFISMIFLAVLMHLLYRSWLQKLLEEKEEQFVNLLDQLRNQGIPFESLSFPGKSPENTGEVNINSTVQPISPFTQLTNREYPGLNYRDEQFLNKLVHEIEKHLLDVNFSIDTLSEFMNMSRSNFYRKIKAMTGHPPNDLLKQIRLEKAAEMLQNEKFRINEIYELAGFSSSSYFAKCFRKQYGMLPREYARKHQAS